MKIVNKCLIIQALIGYLILTVNVTFCQTISQNTTCNNAICISSGSQYSYVASIGNNYSETGPSYGCLVTQRNPAWFYFYANTSGDIQIQMSSNPCRDIDFICWGPFNSKDEGCNGGLTNEKIIDCSYNIGCIETCDIQVIAHKWYFLLTTNFSNQICSITIGQTSGTGIIRCNSNPVAWTNEPICTGQDLVLNCETFTGASYLWTGPSGFTSTLQNPVISAATLSDSGTYSVTVNIGDTILGSTTTHVNIYDSYLPQVTEPDTICYGNTAILSAMGGMDYRWYQNQTGGTPLGNGSSYTTANLYSSDTIWVANSGICETTRVPVPISVVASHIAQNDTSIANGQPVALNVISSSGTNCTYLWSTSDSSSSIIVSPSHSTTYSVTINDGSKSCTDDVKINVIVVVTAPQINSCAGEIRVPVMAYNLNDIAAWALNLTYNSSALSFVDLQNINPEFTNLSCYSYSPNLSFSWYTVFPITYDSIMLFEIRFNGIPGSSSLNWDSSMPGNCEFDDFYGNIVLSHFTNGNVLVDSCAQLEGTVNYLNVLSSPLPNSIAGLYQNNAIVAQDSTDNDGHYLIEYIAAGNYQSGAETTLPWGGGNSSDALLMIKHYVEILQLSGLKLIAADLDGSGYVNATDALLVTKRFVGLINTFPVGDWIFENDNLFIPENSHNYHNIYGLCYGDVDASYLLPAKSQPGITLNQKDTITATGQTLISIPISVNENLEIGSFSLILNLPNTNIQVQHIDCKNNNNLVYNQNGTTLKIAWFNLDPLTLKAGDNLLIITANVDYSQNAENKKWVIEPSSQITNSDAISYDNITLTLPEVKIESHSCRLGQNIPNPFNGYTTIPFYIPLKAMARLVVTDMLGQKVFTTEKQQYEAGNQEINIKFDLMPGVYIYELEINGLREDIYLTRRMIVE